jgi:hypothetical protein
MKKRSVQAIQADLEERKRRLSEIQTLGDKACSQYDLSMGYNAAYYLRTGMIENQIKYYEEELREATDGMLFF